VHTIRMWISFITINKDIHKSPQSLQEARLWLR